MIERASDADAHQPKQLVRWLTKHADAWDRAHPRTLVPFVGATVRATGGGSDRRVTCDELEQARKSGTPVAVYVGRETREGDDAKAKAEVAAARKFEKEVLCSADAAKAASGWTLLRLDRAEADHATLAQSIGIAAAPAIALYLPDVAAPELLDRMTSATTLTKRFKQAAVK